jgi:hypothetical protein
MRRSSRGQLEGSSSNQEAPPAGTEDFAGIVEGQMGESLGRGGSLMRGAWARLSGVLAQVFQPSRNVPQHAEQDVHGGRLNVPTGLPS